jgi:hypothetical protein
MKKIKRNSIGLSDIQMDILLLLNIHEDDIKDIKRDWEIGKINNRVKNEKMRICKFALLDEIEKLYLK